MNVGRVYFQEPGTTVNRNELYPVVDRIYDDIEKLGGNKPGQHGNMKAYWTGEKRPPRKGEYFLSGSSVGAYYARNDLTTVYHIAKLVRVERILAYKVVAI